LSSETAHRIQRELHARSPFAPMPVEIEIAA
jgi:hypothetical protein